MGAVKNTPIAKTIIVMIDWGVIRGGQSVGNSKIPSFDIRVE
ncbi:hypothetical protein RMSM_00043 [Rhodopirellula maiorica SM1]|uniref:Uncharacterized protein n=1 Tax=Rhodopirellula maiorica SM1 TaxID=1265738 RepID=M5SA24_9BACT|nr:hypothetical protein RMSM_00043 [Rhodopirellula maiorica SM1]